MGEPTLVRKAVCGSSVATCQQALGFLSHDKGVESWERNIQRIQAPESLPGLFPDQLQNTGTLQTQWKTSRHLVPSENMGGSAEDDSGGWGGQGRTPKQAVSCPTALPETTFGFQRRDTCLLQLY